MGSGEPGTQRGLEHDGVQWTVDDDGTILTRRSSSDPWDLWDPDEPGPEPPPELLADRSPAGTRVWLWLLPALFTLISLIYLAVTTWLTFDPEARVGNRDLLVNISFLTFRLGVVLIGIMAVGFMVLAYQRFLTRE